MCFPGGDGLPLGQQGGSTGLGNMVANSTLTGNTNPKAVSLYQQGYGTHNAAPVSVVSTPAAIAPSEPTPSPAGSIAAKAYSSGTKGVPQAWSPNGGALIDDPLYGKWT